jgi:hypothetical protein
MMVCFFFMRTSLQFDIKIIQNAMRTLGLI